jgi:hypothetical protein
MNTKENSTAHELSIAELDEVAAAVGAVSLLGLGTAILKGTLRGATPEGRVAFGLLYGSAYIFEHFGIH